MTVPYQYPSEPLSHNASVPIRHANTTMGMVDLGRVSRSLKEAGERRLRRKRSPRCRTLIQTLPDLSWTRAPSAGHWGPLKLRSFRLADRQHSPIGINAARKERGCSHGNEISYCFHGKTSNLPIDFVKIGGRRWVDLAQATGGGHPPPHVKPTSELT